MVMKKLLIVLIFLTALSCRKKNKTAVDNPVPVVPVSYVTYPNDPLNFKIQAIGGWMYVDKVGVNGIIIYRKSQEEFIAIERTSSYLPDNASAKVFVMSDNFILRDTVSDSRWRIIDGTITKGPAEWPLRLYGTSYDGNTLTIRN